jgi:hypothetical protein
MLKALAAIAALTIAAPVAAQITTITTLDGSQGVAAPAGESYANSSATITSDTALSSNGSLELVGGRNRVLNGNNYVPNMNYGSANSLVSLTGDYLVFNGGNGGIQSPAFRVYMQDGATRSELIWEAANNGGYTLGTAGSVGADSLFWQFVTGSGATLNGSGGYVLRTLADWGDLYSRSGFISAFGVGNGGDAGATFRAYADNVVLTTDAGSRGYDFAATAAVPEPATWAMMILGFGMIGSALRRHTRRQALTFA